MTAAAVAALTSLACGEQPEKPARAAPGAAAQPGRQVALRFTAPGGRPVHYLLHLPRDYRSGGRRWPLLLYLHGADMLGSGERGLARLRRQGLPKAVDRRPELPFVTVSPQTRSRWIPSRVVALLDHIARRYAVDRRRVLATGFSLGGYGVWALAAAHPRRLAAIAPIAGGSGSARARCRSRTVALWAFHGTRDDVVPATESKRMVRAVRRCGGRPRLTLFPGAGHFIAERTYARRDLYRWLSAQRR